MPKLSKPNSIKVGINLPFIKVEGMWEPNEDEQRAAWEMYVELVTRISVVKLEHDEGLLREALSSLYTLFDTTRKILRQYGPSVARPTEGNISFGYIAVAILNTVIRPVLAKWHPLLLDYEGTKKDGVSLLEHEKLWDKHDELRQDLDKVREKLIEYVNALSKVASVPPLVIEK